MFPMPRVVYSIASDGLIFKQLAIVMPRLKTPVTAAIASGLLAGLLALIFDLNQLIDMMSIGTLMAYSVVAVCVLVLR
jgi:amino acid transporter